MLHEDERKVIARKSLRQPSRAGNKQWLKSLNIRNVSRQEKEKTEVPASSSGNLTRSKSVSKHLQRSHSKSSRSEEIGEFSVISKGSRKEIRERVRSCSLSRGRSHSPGGRNNNEPACLSPRKGRRERVSMSLFNPKTLTRKLEPKLQTGPVETEHPHVGSYSPGSPNSYVENSIRTNQTWSPSMGRSPAAGFESDLISSSQSLAESPRRRQQPVRRPRLFTRDSGESVREARRRRRESKTETRVNT